MPDQVVEPSAVSREADTSARSARPGWLAAVGGCALLASAVLAFLAHRVAFFPIDLAISRYVQAAPIGWLDLPLRALNALGFVPTVDIVYGGIIGILFAVGWRWEAMASGFAVLGSAGLSHLVKVIVERPRPPMDLIHVERHITNPTFPAGHVLNFTALAGFLCYITYARLAPSWQRAALIAALLTMIGLMGLARIRAGEHWPSDVLGGYLLGVVWVAATMAFYRWRRWSEHWRRRKLPAGRPDTQMIGGTP